MTRPTKDQCLDEAARFAALARLRRDELIDAGRFEDAARLAGCRDDEVAGWIAKHYPDAARRSA